MYFNSYVYTSFLPKYNGEILEIYISYIYFFISYTIIS